MLRMGKLVSYFTYKLDLGELKIIDEAQGIARLCA